MVGFLESTAILAAISVISFKFRLLDWKGIIASVFVGYVVLMIGGLGCFAVLLAFYGLSEVATKVRVRKIGDKFHNKDWVRSWSNVIANGAAASLALLSTVVPQIGRGIGVSGFLGAIAAAFGDTIATEVGLLYPRNPRLITNFKSVERGTPGAVSLLGYAGGVAALLALSGLAYILTLTGYSTSITMLIAGFIGMNLDSLLGATIQAKYRCPKCGVILEKEKHCGVIAEKITGVSAVSTHVVNLIATSAGALISIVLSLSITL